jgi:hypothetical protein
MMQIAYILFWWLALEIIGLVSFPLVSRICGRLKDQGYIQTFRASVSYVLYVAVVQHQDITFRICQYPDLLCGAGRHLSLFRQEQLTG